MKTIAIAVGAVFAAAVVAAPALAADAHAPHWDYKAANKWGDLAKDFSTCKIGKEQSPIDISTKQVEKAALPAIKAGYKEAAGEIVNNGHTIQVNLTDAGSATVPSGEYSLLQFHFHGPSEEKIDGKNFPLVAHMVHRNAAGNLAVIGVLFKVGKENAALKDVFASMPAKEGKAELKGKFNASAMLPANMGYYAFKGSLTTPPCSEGVAWQVLKTPVELSAAQLKAFSAIYKMNARPVQPLNGRKVQEAS
jgi:carbonic anhydrase